MAEGGEEREEEEGGQDRVKVEGREEREKRRCFTEIVEGRIGEGGEDRKMLPCACTWRSLMSSDTTLAGSTLLKHTTIFFTCWSMKVGLVPETQVRRAR